MKPRTRIRGYDEFNYWPSFVDVMTTVSLVFFLIMIICLVLSNAKYAEALKKDTAYTELDKKFKELQEKYNANIKNIDNIAQQRKELYEDVVNKLKPTLKDDVIFSEGRISIKSDVLFASNSSELSADGKILAMKVTEAFYNLLKDDNYSSKIESIEVRGHTDNVGGGEYNRKLSTERAVSFVNEMLRDGSVYEGFAAKFKASGMSKYQPQSGSVYSQSQSDMDKNRRIEIYIKFVDDDIAKAINKLQEDSKK